MAGLYTQIPPAPTWRDLDQVAGRALDFGGKIPAAGRPGPLGWITDKLVGGPGAATDARVAAALAICREVRDEAAANPDLPAATDAVIRLRAACVTLEQEAHGIAWTNTANERDKAELLDKVSDPEAYVDVAKGAALGAASPFNPDSPLHPDSWLPDVKGWFSANKWLLAIAGAVLLVLIVAPLALGAWRRT